jgi:hypothetical protein
MSMMPLDEILLLQTRVVQEMGLYLNKKSYAPGARDFRLLNDIGERSKDATVLTRHLEIEFWIRARNVGK